ncbi:hypothetical protein DVR01_02195 [Limosilactobacillus fermentum]|nr:hypothetical protein DVR01_02195 [Limosilactobacillus fermentum]
MGPCGPLAPVSPLGPCGPCGPISPLLPFGMVKPDDRLATVQLVELSEVIRQKPMSTPLPLGY